MRWTLILVIAFVVSVRAAELAHSARPSESTPPSAACAPQAPKAEAKGIDWDMWTAIGTMALAVTTVGLWGVTYWVGTRQDRAVRTIERAYLFASIDEEFHISASPSGIPTTIRLTVKNYGKTPAEVIQIRSYASIVSEVPQKLLDTPISGSRIPPGFGLAQEDSTLIAIPARITNEDAGQIDRLEKRLYVVGHVLYKDMFGESRITSFCFEHQSQSRMFDLAVNSALNLRT